MKPLDLLSWVLARVRRTPGRSALAVFGIALGAGLLVSSLSICQGIEDEAEASAVWLATPGRLVVTGQLRDADVARLAHLAGARDALPVLPTSLGLQHDAIRLAGGVAGLGYSSRGVQPYRLLAGAPLDPAKPDAVVLSRQASQTLGFATPQAALGTRLTSTGVDATLTVTGVAEELGDQNALIGLPLAEDILAQSAGGPGAVETALGGRLAGSLLIGGLAAGLDPLGYAAVLVVPEHVQDVPKLADEVRSDGYSLLGAGRVPEALQRTFRVLEAGLGALSLLASLVAALGVAHVLASRTAERTAEIGILKTLGATDRQVGHLIGAEAALLGACGGVAGAVGGWLGALVLMSVGQLIFGPLPSPRLNLALMIATAALSMLIALSAAAAPAWRAWRLSPARALRHA